MSVGGIRPLPYSALVPLLCFVITTMGLFPNQSDARVQESETPATTEPVGGGSETEGPAATVGGDDKSSDSSDTANDGLIAVIAVVVILVAVVLAMMFRSDRSPRAKARTRAASSWPARAESLAKDGREVAELLVPEHPSGAGSGLTLAEMGLVDSRLQLLLANLRDSMVTAPSDRARNNVSLAAAHALRMSDIIQEERRLRVASKTPDESMLEELGFQFVAERAALDRALDHLSRPSEGSP